MGSTKVPSSIYALYDCACVVLSLGAGPPGTCHKLSMWQHTQRCLCRLWGTLGRWHSVY